MLVGFESISTTSRFSNKSPIIRESVNGALVLSSKINQNAVKVLERQDNQTEIDMEFKPRPGCRN
jgi:hypothetical protein